MTVIKDYNILNRLGNGTFGDAYLVEHTISKEKYCMKIINIKGKKDIDRILEEVKILQRLSHPYIVKYIDSFMHDGGHLCIVMEYANGGDLNGLLCRQQKEIKKPFPQDLIIKWFTQITIALKYVHDSNVVHRDIKPKNILIHNGNIQLADFGVSKVLTQQQQTSTITGTPHYLSPEICKGINYNYLTDIWSLGVVLYELMALQHPFKGTQTEIMEKIKIGVFKAIRSEFDEDLHSMVNTLLNVNPQFRPPTGAILNRPIILSQLQRDQEMMQIVKDTLKFEIDDVPLFDFINQNSKNQMPQSLDNQNNNNINEIKKEEQQKEKEEEEMMEQIDTDMVDEHLGKLDQMIKRMNTPKKPVCNWYINPKLMRQLSIQLSVNPVNSKAFEVELIRSKLEQIDEQAKPAYESCFNSLAVSVIDYLEPNQG